MMNRRILFVRVLDQPPNNHNTRGFSFAVVQHRVSLNSPQSIRISNHLQDSTRIKCRWLVHACPCVSLMLPPVPCVCVLCKGCGFCHGHWRGDGVHTHTVAAENAAHCIHKPTAHPITSTCRCAPTRGLEMVCAEQVDHGAYAVHACVCSWSPVEHETSNLGHALAVPNITPPKTTRCHDGHTWET